MDWLVLLTFVISLLASIISGLGGGGAGFISTPYLLFIGMPPAQALATSKFGSLGTAVGSMTALRGKKLVHTGLVVPLMAITLVCALVASWLITKIDAVVFEKLIGVVLLVMIPTLFIKKGAFQPGCRSRPWLVAGYIAYTFFSLLQATMGAGMGVLLVLVLMYLFGLDALRANATKRISQTVQAVVLFVLLALQGLVVWSHGVACLAGGIIGTHIGTHIAIKKGADFVKVVLAVVMLASGITLLVS